MEIDILVIVMSLNVENVGEEIINLKAVNFVIPVKNMMLILKIIVQKKYVVIAIIPNTIKKFASKDAISVDNPDMQLEHVVIFIVENVESLFIERKMVIALKINHAI